ncbi:MAG: carboxypeptidase-like regulatory domain-containing protein [Rubripirellula sp.]|nr:carboxypeptidase-like regulatory domain-containing protein [Rubripirellula sp.]
MLLFGDLMSVMELALLDLDYGLCMNGTVPLAEIQGSLPSHSGSDYQSDQAGKELVDHDRGIMLHEHHEFGRMGELPVSDHVLLHGFDHANVEVAILREADAGGQYRFDGLHTGEYFLTRVMPTEGGKWQAIAETDNIFVMPGEIAEATEFGPIDPPAAISNAPPAVIDAAVSRWSNYPEPGDEVVSELVTVESVEGETAIASDELYGTAGTDATLRLPEITEADSVSVEGSVSGSILFELDDDHGSEDRSSILGSIRVVLRGIDGEGSHVFRETIVDADGKYLFAEVPAGTYHLSLRSVLKSIEGGEQKIIVSAGEELEVDLAIKLKPINIPVYPGAKLSPWGWSENSLYLTCLILTGFASTLLMEGYADRARRGLQRIVNERRQRSLQALPNGDR